MADAQEASDLDIRVANIANEKFANKPGGSTALSQDELGAAILDNEEAFLETNEVNARLLQEQDRLLARSMVDQVTGLPNEKAFDDMMQGLEGRWQRDPIWGTFVVADLTGLHKANDTYGRSAGGDDYLKAVGKALIGASRQGDRSFRMGTSADEFVLYLPDITDKQHVSGVLDRIDEELKTIQEGYQSKYPGIEFGLSYAVSSFGEGVSPSDSVDIAMNALGLAKKSKNGERIGTVGRIFTKPGINNEQ